MTLDGNNQFYIFKYVGANLGCHKIYELYPYINFYAIFYSTLIMVCLHGIDIEKTGRKKLLKSLDTGIFLRRVL